MGSGASAGALFDVATDLRLNHEQRQRFRAYYNELQLAGYNENRIKEKLVLKFKNEKGKPMTEEEMRSTRKLQAISRDEYESGSFRSKGSNTHANDRVINRREEMPVIDEFKEDGKEDGPNGSGAGANANGDSGGSKEPKLFCEVCNAKFKTEALLERHVKFSYIHSRTLQERETARHAEIRAKKIATMVHESIQSVRKSILQRQALSARGSVARRRWFWAYDRVKSNIAIAKTTEMLTAYYRSNLKTSSMDATKLLYDGSKLFWRLQLTIDLHMYLHDDEETTAKLSNRSPVIEIVGYDVVHQKELIRLYVNYLVVRDYLKERIQDELVASTQAQSGDDKTGNIVIANYDLNKLDRSETKIMNKTIVNFLASKLDLQTHPNRPTQRYLSLGGLGEDVLAKLQSKSGKHLPASIMVEESIVLTALRPVTILRRRCTNAMDRSSTLNEFMSFKKQATTYTDLAASHVDSNANRSFRLNKAETEQLDDVVERMTKLLRGSSTVEEGEEEKDGEAKPESDESKTGGNDGRELSKSMDPEGFKNYMKHTQSTIIAASAPTVARSSFVNGSPAMTSTKESSVTTSVVSNINATSNNNNNNSGTDKRASSTSLVKKEGPTPRSSMDRLAKREPPTPRSVDRLLTTPQQQREEALALKEMIKSAEASPRANVIIDGKSGSVNSTTTTGGKPALPTLQNMPKAENGSGLESRFEPIKEGDELNEATADVVAAYFQKVDSVTDLASESIASVASAKTSARKVVKQEPVDFVKLSARGGSARGNALVPTSSRQHQPMSARVTAAQ